MSSKPLKIRAEDVEDLDIVAAILQDAISPLCDMTYRDDDHKFIFVVHRFCWDEEIAENDHEHERVCCAVTVSGVTSVKVTGLNQNDLTQMFDLLTVELKDKNMVFVFAGDIKIKLELADWQLRLEDFGEPWPTTYVPVHED